MSSLSSLTRLMHEFSHFLCTDQLNTIQPIIRPLLKKPYHFPIGRTPWFLPRMHLLACTKTLTYILTNHHMHNAHFVSTPTPRSVCQHIYRHLSLLFSSPVQSYLQSSSHCRSKSVPCRCCYRLINQEYVQVRKHDKGRQTRRYCRRRRSADGLRSVSIVLTHREAEAGQGGGVFRMQFYESGLE
jgi:hypothetical protein